MRRIFQTTGTVAACLILAGCASYKVLPLDRQPALAARARDLIHPSGVSEGPLQIGDVALLAVANNPDLRAARARAGVAQAQLLQAGVLPNPQISPSFAPNLYAPAATTVAWAVGVTQDIKSLIMIGPRKESARANAASVQAGLLWQEWQVIGKARLIAVDLIEGGRQRRLLRRTEALLDDLYRRTAHALAAGNATLAQASPELVVLNDVRTQIAILDRQLAAWQHQLAALLGLAPEADLVLADSVALAPIDLPSVRHALPELAAHRPDLVALQLGYAAQEASVRGAILAQFPALLIGIIGGRDNTNDYTIGPQVSFDLPIFDRNQGNIAISRATRQQLHDEYSARLTSATGEVSAMLSEIALLQRQIATVRAEQAATVPVARDAQAAYRAGNLDERSYVDFIRTDLAIQLQIAQMRQSLLEQEVAIATLTGAGMPPMHVVTREGPRA